MSQLLDSLLNTERRQQCEANDRRMNRTHTRERRAERVAKATLRDERAVQDMPTDIHTWATTPSWDDAELYFNQNCREAP